MPGTKCPKIEGRLLDVSEEVVGIAVEHELAHLDQRVVLVEPDLREIERVEAVARRLGVGHHLHLERPGREFAALDCRAQIPLMMLRVLAGDPRALPAGEAADPLVGLEVELHPETLAGVVHPLERVRAEAVHVAVARRDAAIAEQPGELVGRLRAPGEEIPDDLGLLLVGVGVVLLAVDEVGELERIADEEDRRVVAREVPVAVLGIELQRESARIAHAIGRAARARDGREAREHGRLLAHLVHHAHARVAGRRGARDGEVAVGARPDRVHHALGDPLAVEARASRSGADPGAGPGLPRRRSASSGCRRPVLRIRYEGCSSWLPPEARVGPTPDNFQ
jgi:hypothetical protein